MDEKIREAFEQLCREVGIDLDWSDFSGSYIGVCRIQSCYELLQAAHARYAGSGEVASATVGMNTEQMKKVAMSALGVLAACDGHRPIWLSELRGDVVRYIKHLESASPAPAVPDERLLALLDKVQDALQDAYHNAGLVCCGKSMMNCCGSPVADWSESDKKIMDVLSPIQRDLSAMLSASQATKESDK